MGKQCRSSDQANLLKAMKTIKSKAKQVANANINKSIN